MTFNKTLLTAAVLAVGGLSAISGANAATSDTFKVQMNITETCNVTAGSTVNFGDTVSGTAGKTSETTTPIKVNCTNLTAYKLGLSTLTGDAGTGVMLGGAGGAEKIPYQMFSVSANGTPWGNTEGNKVTGTGDGMLTNAKEHNVFITAPATDVSKGVYEDTVTVTVTY